MAAEAAVSSAVQILGNLLIQKVSFLQGVEEQVRRLKVELQYSQCFLKDAAEKQASNEMIRQWISDIREVAHDAEDAIETFILRVDTPRRSRRLLQRCVCLPVHVSRLDKVGKEVESIQQRLDDIRQRRERYKIRNLGEEIDSSRRRSEDVEWRRRVTLLQNDKHLVGLNEDVEVLLHEFVMENEKKGLSIAAIVGMGGIGKSTLARKIYNHAHIADRFEQRVWVVVSSEFTPQETMKQIMLELCKSTEDKQQLQQEIKELEDSTKDKQFIQEKLQEMLHNRLEGKRYFIVFDDVWEQTHWEYFRRTFPDEQGKASRLLLTSRSQNIITNNEGYIHQMKLLNPDESWELLTRTAFAGKTDYRPELEKIGREILKKCEGLPLAIMVMGGMLLKRGESESGWKKVLKRMNSHLDESTSNTISAILELSYQHLPSKLKACFLCLGFFEEDATINSEKLVHIWIALGLVSQEGEETLEETGQGYLEELINWNLVQVKDMSMDDRVKTCHIHDLLRDMAIRKANEEISFEILKEEGSSQSSHKPRHRAVYCSRGRFIDSSTNQNKHLRSLFVHGKIDAFQLSSYWKSFELLKVLEFGNSPFRKLPDAMGALIGLRYLCLGKFSNLYMIFANKWSLKNAAMTLPHWLVKLEYLEVLDLRDTPFRMPSFVWEMKSLRHLKSIAIFTKVHVKTNALKNLQTLGDLMLRDSAIELLAHMTSLCKLSIDISKISNVSKLFASLAMLENLASLKLIDCGSLNMEGLGTLHRITKLNLEADIDRLPDNFPPNLSYLTLCWTYLEEDPMPVLEKLRNLLCLKFNLAYEGEEMVISPDGFPRLRRLCFREIFPKNIRLGEGAMPEIQRWEIYGNKELKIENLPEHVRSALSYID